MALKPNDVACFEVLQDAARRGALALVQSTDKATGDYRAVIAVAHENDTGGIDMLPLGHMATRDPFEEYATPEGATNA